MSEYAYLKHSGRSKLDGAKIGSGRYRLGSGDKPYQHRGLKDRIKDIPSSIHNYKVKKRKQASAKKAREAKARKRAEEDLRIRQEEENKRQAEEIIKNAEERQRQEAEEKVRIINSGDIRLISANRNKLTDQEIQQAINRVTAFNTLDALEKKNAEKGWEKADAVFNKIGKLSTYSEKLINFYNRGANIYNAFNKNNDIELPRISTDFSTGKSVLQIMKRKAEEVAKEKEKKEAEKKKKEESKTESTDSKLKEEAKVEEKEKKKEEKRHKAIYEKAKTKAERHKEEKVRKEEEQKALEKEQKEKQYEYDKYMYELNSAIAEAKKTPVYDKSFNDIKSQGEKVVDILKKSSSGNSSSSVNDRLMKNLEEYSSIAEAGAKTNKELEEQMEIIFKVLNSKK